MDSPRRLTVTIPLPPVGCKQNTRVHWRVASNATRMYRQDVRTIARGIPKGGGPLFLRATVAATFYCAPVRGDRRYRPLDGGNANAALKAAIDGLVDARVLAGDDHRSLRMMPPVLLRTKREHGGRAEVVLEIEEWGEGP